MSALAAAVEGGNVRAALDLLSKGADVNEKGVVGRGDGSEFIHFFLSLDALCFMLLVPRAFMPF